ncbi:MAG: acetylxylan esterase [Planctomycetota bacterium]
MRPLKPAAFFVAICSLGFSSSVVQSMDAPGDRMLREYFALETDKLRAASLREVQSIDDWKSKRKQYRRELLDMLGLDPMPPRTALRVQVTGRVDHAEFTVENLHFQSRPGLYVTGNLYVPKKRKAKLPAILYVCGHGRVIEDGVSYGNKTYYQHHPAWFARHGYVCLIIDTLQLGEIQGTHHGTYRHDMWWWLNRGYTPAGVEAWNCVRALDLLESRKEVDATRIGVTGRSGGGAYSWWISAIDERIRCSVPVAGIADLQNHVVAGMPGRFHDGCVEGHCDCMYMLNTYRWDYDKVAALVAPRPLFVVNTDSDEIFPLDGVHRVFESTRRIYRLHGVPEKIAIGIGAGGHKDTPPLRSFAFQWFERHLKGSEEFLRTPAEKFFEPAQLKVFSKLPSDQLNTKIHESFVSVAKPVLPKNRQEWERTRSLWKNQLEKKTFGGWPKSKEPLNVGEVVHATRRGISLRVLDYTSQAAIRLRLFVVQRAGLKESKLVVFNVLDEANWSTFLSTFSGAFPGELPATVSIQPDSTAFSREAKMLANFSWTMIYIAPRGIGPSAWDPNPRKQIQHRRRFNLLGQSLDGMRVYDVRRAIAAARSHLDLSSTRQWIQSWGRMAGVALYASLFEDGIERLDLHELPSSHRSGPFLLNVRRTLDLPQAVTMALERSRVTLYREGSTGFEYSVEAARRLGWEKRLQFREPVKD